VIRVIRAFIRGEITLCRSDIDFSEALHRTSSAFITEPYATSQTQYPTDRQQHETATGLQSDNSSISTSVTNHESNTPPFTDTSSFQQSIVAVTANELINGTTSENNGRLTVNDLGSGETIVTETAGSQVISTLTMDNGRDSEKTTTAHVSQWDTIETDTAIPSSTTDVSPFSQTTGQWSSSEHTSNMPSVERSDLTLSLSTGEANSHSFTGTLSATTNTGIYLSLISATSGGETTVKEEPISSLASETSGKITNEMLSEAHTMSSAQTNLDLIPLFSITDDFSLTSTSIPETSTIEDYNPLFPSWTNEDSSTPWTSSDRVYNGKDNYNARNIAMDYTPERKRSLDGGEMAAIVICSIVAGLVLIIILLAMLYLWRYK
jgi:hypothetical protein